MKFETYQGELRGIEEFSECNRLLVFIYTLLWTNLGDSLASDYLRNFQFEFIEQNRKIFENEILYWNDVMSEYD